MNRFKGLGTRTITGILIFVVIVPLIATEGPGFFILGIMLSMIAAFEMMTMFYKESPSLQIYRWTIPILAGVIVSMVYISTTRGLVFDPSLSAAQVRENLLYHFWTIGVFVVAIIIVMGMTIFIKDSTAKDMTSAIMTLVYCGLIMGYVISIKYIQPIQIPDPENTKVITKFLGGRSFGYLFSIAVATDMMAYFIGVKFGKHKLCPDISPKKSVEGAIAGLIAGTIVGTGAVFLFNMVDVSQANTTYTIITIAIAAITSMVLSFSVQVGDLVASKIKRTYNIKDFGKIFPGHGGVLDRFDSLIFSGGVFYLILQFIQLIVLGAT